MQKGYWSAWFTALLYFLAYYALLVPVPLYLEHIGLPNWEIGIILGAFGVAALICRPVAGWLADSWGYRPVMLIGTVTLMFGAIGMSLTTQPTLLFICRLLQAAGYASFTTAATALIAALAAPEKRGSALAFFGISVNAAMAVTPAIINSLLVALTLRGAFWLSGAIAVVTGLLAWGSLPQGKATKASVSNWRTVYSIPRTLWIPASIAALFGIGYGAFIQFLPLLAEKRPLGPSGTAFAVYGVSIILTRLTTGKWLDRSDRRPIMAAAIIVLATGLAGFALANAPIWLWVAAALTALSSGILHPALIATHVNLLPDSETGRATGTFYIGFDLGIGLGAWILSPALQWLGLTSLYLLAALAVAAGLLLLPTLGTKSISRKAESLSE
jgi:MFS family permease